MLVSVCDCSSVSASVGWLSANGRVGEWAVCLCEQIMFVIQKMTTQATELNHGTLCPAAADVKAADAKACGLLPLLSARVT